MYQTFTGTSKRPRQVNLSGRPSNPFAVASAPGNPQAAIASAQQDRLLRQQQRERLQASSRIQKVWRGHRDRRKTFQSWRAIWDEEEQHQYRPPDHGAYQSPEVSLRQLQRLLLFFDPKEDVGRLTWYGMRQLETASKHDCENGPWPRAYFRITRASTAAIMARSQVDQEQDSMLLTVMGFAARRTYLPLEAALPYYEALTQMHHAPEQPLRNALVAPLQRSTDAYVGLALLLAKPLDEDMVALLRSAIDLPSLTAALTNLPSKAVATTRARLWLLGNVLCLTHHRNDSTLLALIAKLLGGLADDVDFESSPVDQDNMTFDREILAKLATPFPLNTYLREQTSALISMDAVRNLLVWGDRAGEGAQLFAGYALTLLRCFPRRADDIRMWLYLGPSRGDTTEQPATLYFWNAARSSSVYKTICQNSRNVLPSIKTTTPGSSFQDDWTLIMVFLELYTFMLKIMDDEEFMGATVQSKRNSAIPLADVSSLVIFLKNLGFTLYFNAAELQISEGASARDTASASLARHFGNPVMASNVKAVENKPLTIAGLAGLTVDYLKGLTTGLLRAIYERDSRRHFLPVDHWLMTARFDMVAFIPGVVAEEENRHLVQEQDEQDVSDDDHEEDEAFDPRAQYGGHGSILRSQEARARAQRKASRKRFLESVAPRLEVLQNMPFFIPFNTRVEIFRQFVQLDQRKRRFGQTDPDMWRHAMISSQQAIGLSPHDVLARHHAKIRRKNEFMDAFEQFYDLGVELKEPIQITFVDEFDIPEAGIDGGGVTKEFLTSVISQAFDPADAHMPHHFFVENEKHLLHPAPTVIEDAKKRLELMDLHDKASTIRRQIKGLLRQYEFLGRIIGKCLYEGILVDVNFAGFFLKKWSLTGGANSAPLESGYRANINDLRELDADLYKGLLAVKNASADELEAFGLTFTVDEMIGPEGHKQVVERDLIPNGSNTTVTMENKLLYVNRMSWYRLQGQSALQTNAFLKGLSSIIQPSWLSMFNQGELQTLIGGAAAEIDVADLRRNTLYGGTYVIGNDGQEHPSVQIFWDIMTELPDQQRRNVLKFVTSTPRGPLLGFRHLNPRFSIRDSGRDENRYPTTSTCVNLLKLPMYQTARVMREKLLAAVNSGAGFDLS